MTVTTYTLTRARHKDLNLGDRITIVCPNLDRTLVQTVIKANARRSGLGRVYYQDGDGHIDYLCGHCDVSLITPLHDELQPVGPTAADVLLSSAGAAKVAMDKLAHALNDEPTTKPTAHLEHVMREAIAVFNMCPVCRAPGATYHRDLTATFLASVWCPTCQRTHPAHRPG